METPMETWFPLKRTDHVDCYLGPNESAPAVYVIHQRKAGDEHWIA
jgi:hypothetical protein